MSDRTQRMSVIQFCTNENIGGTNIFVLKIENAPLDLVSEILLHVVFVCGQFLVKILVWIIVFVVNSWSKSWF